MKHDQDTTPQSTLAATEERGDHTEFLRGSGGPGVGGRLIVNVDDWGRDCENTDRTLDCFLRGSVSAVSAMVFMSDSERAAEIAREHGIDAGLHMNLTSRFTSPHTPSRLQTHQERISRFLKSSRFATVVYHPGLASSFEYVVSAQREEFYRLYGGHARRIDGHHHMHLCANVLLRRLLPPGILVRRNFSFMPGEKSSLNLAYRRFVDGILARRYQLTDFFFSLPPLEPRQRLERIFALAKRSVVEVETHAVNPEEYRFLTSGGIFRYTSNTPIASGFLYNRVLKQT